MSASSGSATPQGSLASGESAFTGGNEEERSEQPLGQRLLASWKDAMEDTSVGHQAEKQLYPEGLNEVVPSPCVTCPDITRALNDLQSLTVNFEVDPSVYRVF